MFVSRGAVAASAAAYSISNSLRFNSASSQYLTRTPAGAGNRKLLTHRYRVKRGKLSTVQVIASAGTASIDRFYFDASDRLCLDVLGTVRLVTTAVFRDPASWYVDVGFTLDVANGTAASRAAILVNGTEVSAYATDSRSLITNTDTNWNNTVVQYLGRDNAGNYFDGHLAEPIAVDGSTTVGEYSTTSATTAQRIPALPSATYGTTGYYLPFSSGTNTTTLGADSSGNGNNWTLTSMTRAAGVSECWMTDTPTNNFANLGLKDAGNAAYLTIGGGGLKLTQSGVGTISGYGSIAVTSGKYYYEVTVSTLAGDCIIGMVQENPRATLMGPQYRADGTSYNGTSWIPYGASYTTGDVIGAAFDRDNSTVEYFKNGVSQGVRPLTITRPVALTIVTFTNGNVFDLNFGQRAFAYTPPTGYLALSTANLTSDTVVTSSSFTGNADVDGPFIWCNGTPDTLTINGNAVTWLTHADKLSNGFKLRTSSASYNAAGTNNWTATVLSPSSKSSFRNQRAKVNP